MNLPLRKDVRYSQIFILLTLIQRSKKWIKVKILHKCQINTDIDICIGDTTISMLLVNSTLNLITNVFKTFCVIFLISNNMI